MTRRSGLGRGLDALLPSQGTGLEERGALQSVPLSLIDPNPRQPRRSFEEEALEELAASIRQLGVLQPLLVRELAGGRYELIAGERRARAAQRAGLEDVPVLVVETDERGSLERALVENVQRTDLNPIEEAAAYRQLIEDGGLTHEVVAERVGRNRVTVTSVLRLLDLPIPVQRLLIDGRLSAAHGRILLRLQGNPFQERLARRAADEGLSVRETEEQVRRYESIAGVSPPTGRTRAADEQSAVLTELQRRLADRLQTRVRIQMGKRKGKLVVDFVSVEELERITQLMLVDLSSERMVVRPE